jgi:hypothetical protein
MAAIVAATAATNNKSNESVNLSLLKTYEAGSALAIDAASYAESAKASASACSSPPFGIKVLQAAVVGGASYPRRFVVLGSSIPLPLPKGCTSASSSCPNADSFFEFEQSRPGASWKIVLEPSANAGRIADFVAHGSVVVPLSVIQADAAQRLPTALAGALRRYEMSGKLGPLRASEFTSSCWLLPNPRAAFEQYVSSDVNEQQSYSPASDAVSVPVAGGRVLSLFTLQFVSTLAPGSSEGSIDWISDPSAEPVTGLLATGQYSRVVETGSLEVAAETGSAGGFTIIGAYSGVTSITGTKGSTSPGPGGGILVSYAGR